VTTIVNMTFRKVEIDDTLLLIILRVRTQMNRHRILIAFFYLCNIPTRIILRTIQDYSEMQIPYVSIAIQDI